MWWPVTRWDIGGWDPEAGLRNALIDAPDYTVLVEENKKAARDKHRPSPPPHWAVMGRLKIALFTTRDDSKLLSWDQPGGWREEATGATAGQRDLIRRAVIWATLGHPGKVKGV